MRKTLTSLAVLLCCVFLWGCDAAKPKIRPEAERSSDSQSSNDGGKAGYLELRGNFKTKLTRRGPSPQEMDGDPPEQFVREVKYPSEGRTLKGWVYVPNNDKNKRRPALVFCHGGFAADANDMMCVEPFMNGDYVVFGPAWRGESGNPGDFELMFGEVDDAANAVRWLAKQPYVDPDNIYMFGHSVGGGISALVSLMDDIPLRHSGSSGGLYPEAIFQAWRGDVTPFNDRDKKECSMRLLDGNTQFMQRNHYAFLGKEDYKDVFHLAAKKYVEGKVAAPMLTVTLIPGDHFSSFDEATRRYFDIVEKDRKTKP